jgi:hypothetical protein
VLGALQLIRRLVDAGLVALPPVGGLIPVDWDCAGCVAEVRWITQLVAAAALVAPRTEITTLKVIAHEIRLAMSPAQVYSRQEPQLMCS